MEVCETGGSHNVTRPKRWVRQRPHQISHKWVSTAADNEKNQTNLRDPYLIVMHLIMTAVISGRELLPFPIYLKSEFLLCV